MLRFVRRFLPAIASFAVVYWIGSGVFTVAPDERGVVTRFGAIVHRSLSPGIHYALPWPIDCVYTPRITDVKRIEVGFRFKGKLYSELRRSDMMTGDENILKLEMVVQWKIRDPIAYLFGAEAADWLVERAVESAMSRRAASMTIDAMLTSAKEEFQIDVIDAAQKLLDVYASGITLVSGNLQDVSPPVPVLDAFTDVSSARKDAERAVDVANAYAGRMIPQARGEAQDMLSTAEGFYAERVNKARGEARRFEELLSEYRSAPNLTRARLFIDSMERVLSQVSVIVVEEGQQGRRARIQIVEPRR